MKNLPGKRVVQWAQNINVLILFHLDFNLLLILVFSFMFISIKEEEILISFTHTAQFPSYIVQEMAIQ